MAATSAVAQHVLVRDGEAVPCEEASGPWLKAAPRGAYTTARTVQRWQVFKLASHIQRLATSANLMVAADARASDHLAADPPLFSSEDLRPLVVGSMATAIQCFMQADPSNASKEVKLTVLLTWTPDGHRSVLCHAEALPPRPASPVKVLISGMPRVNAKAKDSEWVRQRQVLEQSKGPGVNEVVLAGPHGELMEGLSSNFFVLQGGEVLTADEGVLSGTVRELVLEVAGTLGIPVKFQPPLLSDVESWQGAFISSTSRLLLPINEVHYHPLLSSSQGDDHQRHPAAEVITKVYPQQHPLLEKLEAAVMERILAESEPLTDGPAA